MFEKSHCEPLCVPFVPCSLQACLLNMFHLVIAAPVFEGLIQICNIKEAVRAAGYVNRFNVCGLCVIQLLSY